MNTSLVIFFIFLIIIYFVAEIIKSPSYIGRQGENFVTKKILSELNPINYTLINDIMLPTISDIGTTQIDHIIVSNFGIFCIETKAYSGWILGRESDKYWTQSINYKKYRFFNPLRQNYLHTKTLEKILNESGISTNIHSFIAFPNAEKLKITGTDKVGYARDIVAKIKECQDIILSEEEKNKIVSIINQFNITDNNLRQLHSQNIRIKRKF